VGWQNDPPIGRHDRLVKVAFYPCCNRDIEEPRRILAGEADRILFCDVDPSLEQYWANAARSTTDDGLPATELVLGDALTVLSRLDTIDVLFYRRDSEGEGGSGLFVLGDVFLRPLLQRFAPKGGLIITDGSNSRGSNFERMVRPTGLVKHGWRFSASSYQPYRLQHGLWRISVLPVANDGE
jgi:hypothetical protein